MILDATDIFVINWAIDGLEKNFGSRRNMKEIKRILKSGQLSGFRGYPAGHMGGEYVQEFEGLFRKRFGVKYAIAFNSATSALHASLVACGVGQGDEVIVTPYSFSSSASCVLMVGAKPVFCDITDGTFNIDPLKIEALITPKTKAIIPVHLMGHPAEMIPIEIIANKHKLKIIEDAAQSIGATYYGEYVGTIGDCGIFSFNQSKHVNTGEGGMLITDDDNIARVCRAVRNHGEVSDPNLKILGYNYRMCEIEAAIGAEQFRRLDNLIEIRVHNAERLTEALSDIEELTPPIIRLSCTHTFYTYGVKVVKKLWGEGRDTLQKELLARGIYFGSGYVKPLYLLPIYQQFGYGEGLCPVCESMWSNELMVTDIIRLKKLDVKKIQWEIKDILSKM